MPFEQGRSRVTKIVCGCCEGSGQSSLLDMTCTWCEGEGRLQTSEALRYADTIYTLAGGGYIFGDNTYQEMIDEERRAQRIYQLAGVEPEWRVR